MKFQTDSFIGCVNPVRVSPHKKLDFKIDFSVFLDYNLKFLFPNAVVYLS